MLRSREPRDRDVARPELVARLASYLAVLASTIFVIFQLRPDLLVSTSMDVGGDNAAHVVAVHYFIHHLLAHAQLSGWDPQWFGGFPLYVFYFPLPALIIAALNAVVSYATAFKLVSVLGTVLLPVTAYVFGRLAGLRRPVPALMSVFSLAYLFNTSYTIDGGNIPSTLAGEFSFSLALVFALLFLGNVVFSLRTGGWRWPAPILFALTLLCHVVPALFASGAAVLLVLTWRDRRRAFKVIAPIGVCGALLSAFWLLRFATDLSYSSSMGYTRVTGFFQNLFPLSTELAVPLLAIIGTIYAIVRGERVMRAVALAALCSALAFNYLPSGLVFNGRWLPFWFLSTTLLAAYAVSELGSSFFGAFGFRSLNDSATTIISTVGVIAVIAAYLGILPFVTTPASARSFIPSWVAWNYTGYEGKSGWSNFQSLVSMLDRTMARDGCGRLDYEYSPNFSNPYGSTLVPMSLPMWTNGCVQTTEGLYFESSTTTPFHFLDQAQLSIQPSNPVVGIPYQSLDVADGVRHLALTGVRYFLANSAAVEHAAAVDPQLTEIASTPADPAAVETSVGATNPHPRWILYRVANAPIVRPLRYEPVVEPGLSKATWLATAIRWYQTEQDWPVVLTTAGPAAWRRHAAGLVGPSAARQITPVRATHVVMTNDSVSFDVTRDGVPVVVNVPDFPNWHATGATGPYLATPNMMVVVPTAHHVSLHYASTRTDWIGRILTVVGIAALVPLRTPLAPDPLPQEEPAAFVAAIRERRRRATALYGPDSAATPAERDSPPE